MIIVLLKGTILLLASPIAKPFRDKPFRENCDRGLENAARGSIFKPEVTVFPYTDRA